MLGVDTGEKVVVFFPVTDVLESHRTKNTAPLMTVKIPARSVLNYGL